MATTKVKNTGLNNSSITINGSAVSLGGSVTVGETKPTVANVAQTIASDTATTINITGTNFIAIPQVQFIKSDTGAIITANTVSFTNATTLSVNVTLALGNYFVRIENPDGNAGRSTNNILTASTAPIFSTNAGSLGTIAGDFSGAVATVAASSDSAITFSETTNVLTNSSQANCSLNPNTGAITTTDFGGSSTSGTAYNFTLKATDVENQFVTRAFSLTSSFFTGTAYYLVVAGGGSGGKGNSGGGGAGGYLTNYGGSAYTLAQGITYTVTVGAGGASIASNASSRGNNGGYSSFTGSNIVDITSIGGGGGGGASIQSANNGGSGGGGPYNNATGGGAGTSGQGNNGGQNQTTGPVYGGSGGGGAGGTGFDGEDTKGGNGGVGLSNSITGSAVYYAGGGGGSSDLNNSTGGTGGNGGGGNGSFNTQYNGTDGLGGGGGSIHTAQASGKGGNGVVILRILTSAYNLKTGITGTHTATAVGSDTVVKWTGSGNITF